MRVILKHIDPAENMHRWYIVSVEQTLFGDTAVVCRWGSLLNSYQQTSFEIVVNEAAAEELAAKIVEGKIKRGYEQTQMEET